MLIVKFPVKVEAQHYTGNHYSDKVFDISYCDRVEPVLSENDGMVIGVRLIHFPASNLGTIELYEEAYSFELPNKGGHQYYDSCYVETAEGRTLAYLFAGKEA